MKEENLKNGLVGEFGGYRINGKTFDPDGKEIEEKHEANCFCCRKDLGKNSPKEIITN